MQSHLEEARDLLTAVRRRYGDYRERAEQLRAMAATETDPRLRDQLLMLASQYRQLVERETPSGSTRRLGSLSAPLAAARQMPVNRMGYPTRKRRAQFEELGVWLIISLAVWAMLIIGIVVVVVS
jgi:hypothetical protein